MENPEEPGHIRDTDEVIIEGEVVPPRTLKMKMVNMENLKFEVTVAIEPMQNKQFKFMLDKSKHLNLTMFLKEVCDVSKVKTDQELVLQTFNENRIIVDINAIEKGEMLKLANIPPEIHQFKQKINEIFQQRQMMMNQQLKNSGGGGAGNSVVKNSSNNPTFTGLRRRGRPPSKDRGDFYPSRPMPGQPSSMMGQHTYNRIKHF